MTLSPTTSTPPPPTDSPAVLTAVLERVTYSNEETGYTVARVTTGRDGDLLTVVGPLAGAQPGEHLRMEGRWRNHAMYGRQFEVHGYTTVLPATVQGIRRYLGSGLIKGIGPKMAERIVDHFGVDTLRVLEEAPERLHQVPGLGPKRTTLIERAWEEQKAIKEVMVFLQGVGVSTSLGVRIYKTYGDEAVRIVTEEPYRLAMDIWGIGFKTADKIAQNLGIAYDSAERVKAGLRHTLSEASEAGHCHLRQTELIAKASEILGVRPALAEACLEELVRERGVIRDQGPIPAFDDNVPAIYLVPFHRAEVSRSAGLLRVLHSPEQTDRLPWFRTVDWTVALEWLHRSTGHRLTHEQAAAVRLALTERVAVVTGGPGCGKSYTMHAVVTLARAKKAKVLLANKLVKAVPSGAHLLLVGDVDQLPSVGPGEVLRDLLDAHRPEAAAGDFPGQRGRAVDVIPRVRLTRIFRQVQESGVVTNAHRINAGQPPVTRGLPDFFLFPEEDPERVADLVIDVVANRLPRRFGVHPQRDVQVLCPMYRGPAGAAALNERLQQALTPGSPDLPERRFAGRTYRLGDKVMQIRNDYDKGVFNGSVGVVTALSLDEQELRVLLDEDQEVRYGFDELDELVHAYAVTVHRSQGSEYPCVVVPLTLNAWLMLQRNLLYTAVTRAKGMVVLVGSRRALARAVRTTRAGRRYTALDERLCRGSRRVAEALLQRSGDHPR